MAGYSAPGGGIDPGEYSDISANRAISTKYDADSTIWLNVTGYVYDGPIDAADGNIYLTKPDGTSATGHMFDLGLDGTTQIDNTSSFTLNAVVPSDHQHEVGLMAWGGTGNFEIAQWYEVPL